ncbi:MAG: DNA translocase FtsK [Acholeplasmatales bacterium]|nr:DNA translocase FtsK [Acholeplasmatales bacterium]
MKKNKKKNDQFIEDDEKFIIYQMSYGTFDPDSKFRPSQVCSPIFGSKILDRTAYTDNKGSRDVDYHYDYVRKEEEKHLTDEDIKERFGSEYHEFQILDNKKIADIAGVKLTNPEDEMVNEVLEEKKEDNSFISSIDDIMEDESLEEVPQEEQKEDEYLDENININISIEAEEDDTMEYNSVDEKMPKPTPRTIPNFLFDKDAPKPSNNNQELDLDGVFGEDEGGLSFDDIPTMAAPEIEFETHNNAPIDRNITIEEAIRRGNNNEFPPTMDEVKAPKKPTTTNVRMEETVKPVESKYAKYSIPYEELFSKTDGSNDEHPAWLEEKKNIINETLSSFGIDGEVIDYTKGPTFTLFEIMLNPGVKTKRITELRDNFAMNLSVKSLRILAPIPGKNTVGIEAPNDVKDMVKFGDILTEEIINDKKPLNVAMGKDIYGKPVNQNIVDMPHALIAGATKSGKSVSINTILASLLVKNSPERLKLILVDPKMVEFTFYEDIPHLAAPVITDPNLAGEVLKWACDEMDRRYLDLAKYRVRNIDGYNDKRKDHPEVPNMPFIVIVLDEFCDLAMQCGQELTDNTLRLAQKARACGMHILLATQRPTTNIVNGNLKANIPCRIAFKVASAVDSVTILDEGGAEELLGYGDMLIKNNGAPFRAQGAYLSDSELEALCEYLVSKYGPDYMFTIDDLKKSYNKNQASGGMGLNAREAQAESEELLYNVALYCVDSQTCSINSIQNNFGLGFNRASRIVSILEERNIVSPKNGTKSRDILVDRRALAEMFEQEYIED